MPPGSQGSGSGRLTPTATTPALAVRSTLTRSATLEPGARRRSWNQPIGLAGALPMPVSSEVLALSCARVSGKLTPPGSVAGVKKPPAWAVPSRMTKMLCVCVLAMSVSASRRPVATTTCRVFDAGSISTSGRTVTGRPLPLASVSRASSVGGS